MPEIEQLEVQQMAVSYSRNHMTSVPQAHLVGEPVSRTPAPKPRLTGRPIVFADLTRGYTLSPSLQPLGT